MRRIDRHSARSSRQHHGVQYCETTRGQERNAWTSTSAAMPAFHLPKAHANASATKGSEGMRNRVPMLEKYVSRKTRAASSNRRPAEKRSASSANGVSK